MSKIKAIILAAGAGTRMKSEKPKVLHEILGSTMLQHVINAGKEACVDEICVVIGHKADMARQSINKEILTVVQKEQLGTGHAVMQAEEFIDEDDKVLVLFGDAPLITGETLKRMIQFHDKNANGVTVLSSMIDDPTGYGRIVRGNNGEFIKSVEHKDATKQELKIKEVNSGMYCFEGNLLRDSLKKINNENAQKEYYLPDTLKILMNEGNKVDAMVCDNYVEILGVNSRKQLHDATMVMQERINTHLMDQGVTIISSSNTFISPEVNIGKDTIIYQGCIIEGNTKIGEGCIIGPNSRIMNSQIQDKVKIDHSTVLNSTIGSDTTVGPYAYIRPNCNIGEKVKIGDFVEVKNSNIGNNTKASHLTYIGDADVGNNINFGCGSVIVNYDGINKHRTVIEDGAFIGCNTNLISPVTVNKNGYTAAGSTITNEVPKDSLAIARAKQVNIEDWVNKRRK